MRTLPTLPEADYSRLLDDPAKSEPGFGALRTARGLLPLEALDVEARLDGLIAAVEVRQTFVNHHTEPLEATYIFPLPDRAAVTAFRLEVAGRVVEGELRERAQARQRYDEAIRQGHRAAIAEEERPGVFTMRVGNLPPGERARVRLTLAGPLPYCDGEVTFRFPLVVAPRYIPGEPLAAPPVGAGTSPDTTSVPDASRISPPVLLPGFPSPVRLSLRVEAPPSPLAPRDFRSSLHTAVEEGDGETLRFRLRPGEKLHRDFVLRYRLADAETRTSLTVRPDEASDAGTFLLTLVPSAHAVTRQRPRDVVFVLDRSGSMAGWKMVTARRAVARMVETLADADRFTVIAFDDKIETPHGFDGTTLVPGSDGRRFQAAEFLARVTDRGGTEMAEPLVQAVRELTRSGADAGRDRVLVLITDGQVGNEDEILRRLGKQAAGVRIFTLGIDQAVNAGFLRRLADLGGGVSEVVESESRLDEVMDSVHRHIGTALLTGLELRAEGLDLLTDTLVPARLPDLFAGSPVLITGRYRGGARGAVVLQARDADGRPWSAEAAACRDDKAPLAAIWARGRVRNLEDRYAAGACDRAKLEHKIVETSLRFGVLSRFTAFVAVDRSEVVNEGGRGKQLIQPVEMPAGWGQETLLAMHCARPAALGAMPFRGRAAPGYVGYCESVDSMLAEFDAEGSDGGASTEAFSAPAPDEASGGGLLGRLRKKLFGAKRGGASAGLDRLAFRPRAEEILRRLRESPAADLPTRWPALRAELLALLKALIAAGDTDASLPRLEQATEGLTKLLALSPPADGAWVEKHVNDVTDALEAWLKLTGTSTNAAFWK